MLLVVILVVGATAHESDLDYTTLAEEAEAQKSSIITFLNQSHVQSRYRALYDKLLAKLNGKCQSLQLLLG